MRTIGLILLVGALLLAGCSVQHTVTYKTDFVGEVAFTYTNGEGGTEQETARAPWEKTFKMRSGSFAYVAAQNHAAGSLTVQILVDGKRWRSSTATGQYAIATAQGRLE